MAVNSDTAAAGQSGWAVYYRGPHVVVTSQYVENPDGRYPLSMLSDFDRVVVRPYPAWKIALFVGCLEVLIAVPLAIGYGSGALICAGFIAACGVAGGTLVDGRRNPRWMALTATYQFERIELFSSRSSREFEQVRRALIRAVEYDRDLRL